tara:strand:+ start:1210 stop:1503 length:294 start_codon:yes stop_codon:yes gene_type:complete
MTQLFTRQPSGDSEWTDEAAAICNSFADSVRFAMKEAELDGPVDLRDLQTIMKSAIDDVIHHEMICRRLRPNEDAPPRGERGTQGGEWNENEPYEMT